MDRRTFFKRGIGLAALAAGTPGLAKAALDGRPVPPVFGGAPDLVAIKGGEADEMFRKGIAEFGGMKAFVKKGQKVVIKPNIGWDVTPERGGNTNPKLVREIIRHCYDAGAREVVVFDNTCDNWQRSYKNSGIAGAVNDAGGKIAPGNTEGYYHEVSIPGSGSIAQAKVQELILESDVFINVPILKNHGSTKLTVTMKNLMGIVWDRKVWHANDLHQYIADFAAYKKPTLNVVDAYYVMKRNGPRGISPDDVATMKSQLITTDMVAADTAAAKLFGLNPSDVRYISLAAERKAGRMDLENLAIRRLTM